MAKQRFLAAYDYDTGGVWIQVWAHTANEIIALYPELDVLADRPPWMTDTIFAELHEYDIDAPPTGFLAVLIESRARSATITGRDRPIFTVGALFHDEWRWVRVRARSEFEVVGRFPGVTFKHGKDVEWQQQARASGELEAAIYDLDELPGAPSIFEAISGI